MPLPAWAPAAMHLVCCMPWALPAGMTAPCVGAPFTCPCGWLSHLALAGWKALVCQQRLAAAGHLTQRRARPAGRQVPGGINGALWQRRQLRGLLPPLRCVPQLHVLVRAAAAGRLVVPGGQVVMSHRAILPDVPPAGCLACAVANSSIALHAITCPACVSARPMSSRDWQVSRCCCTAAGGAVGGGS